jgi:Na+-transporting methylmalonyl-CoA/oxaloacetate decarboxylase gamma subunit
MALVLIWVFLYVWAVLVGPMSRCTRSPVDEENADEESAMEGDGEGYGSMRREHEGA